MLLGSPAVFFLEGISFEISWKLEIPFYFSLCDTLTPLLPWWGWRQPCSLVHVMTQDTSSICQQRVKKGQKQQRLFLEYSCHNKCVANMTWKLWFISFFGHLVCPFSSGTRLLFRTAPLSCFSSCLDGLIWGFGFHSPPMSFTALLVWDATKSTLPGQSFSQF